MMPVGFFKRLPGDGLLLFFLVNTLLLLAYFGHAIWMQIVDFLFFGFSGFSHVRSPLLIVETTTETSIGSVEKKHSKWLVRMPGEHAQYLSSIKHRLTAS